jgi:hypothetical protein
MSIYMCTTIVYWQTVDTLNGYFINYGPKKVHK